MKDRKRLEKLENGSAFSSDDITFLLKQARLYQISREDTREKCHEIRCQNKQYKELIENTLCEMESDIEYYNDRNGGGYNFTRCDEAQGWYSFIKEKYETLKRS